MPRFLRLLARSQEGSATGSTTQAATGAATPPAHPAGADELRQVADAAWAGDADAAATLVSHVSGSMLVVIRKVMGGGCPDVDDVAQDAVIALFRALGTFRGDCTVAHFANRVALLTALAARRQARARVQAGDEPVGEVRDAGARSPLASAAASRRRALVRRLLDELPDVIANALAMHFILGYTVEEIADADGVSPNTVWSRLRLGKKALRRKLDGDQRLAEILREELPR